MELKYENLDKWDLDTFNQMGINPKDLTPKQIYYCLEPVFAPENYHQDGEITPTQARFRWSLNLEGSGLSKENVRKAMKFFK